MEHKTLLIDFDIRNPSLGALFMDKVDYTHSLNALYRGEATEEDAITPLTGYLDLLPAVLEHNAMSMDGTVTELIQRLREKYEYIILDSAPVGEASETLSLNRVANTVLFVIGYDSTPLPVIQSALEKLDKSGIRVLGCVVNAVGEGSRKISDVDKKAARTASAVDEASVWSAAKAPKATRHQKPKKKPATIEVEPITPPAAPKTAQQPQAADAKPAEPKPQALAKRRDVMSELMAEEMAESNTERSTQSVMDELMQMGKTDDDQ